MFLSNFTTRKGISKKLQPLRKGTYQIIDKPTEVTYKLTDLNKKKSFNTIATYYLITQKKYALRELTQLYSFTGLSIVQNNPQIEQNQNVNTTKNTKQFHMKI